MANPSPLQERFEQMQALFMPFGEGVKVAGEVDSHEVEYAAIRKSVGMLDCPHRGLLRLTGGERLDFLHRMLTNNCNAMAPGSVQRNFLLTARGRIIADLLVLHEERETLIDVAVHQAREVADELDKLLFGEDVRIEDLSQTHHRLSLHGPRAPEALRWWQGLAKSEAGTWEYRYDETGEPGVHIWMEPDNMTRFSDADESLLAEFELKPIGWLAFNIARIEAGRPLFHIDFGPDSLPHETGADTLHEAVDFTAGCYRGQEIVARMESLGHPAKTLVGFRVPAPDTPDAGDQPVPTAGSPVMDSEDAEAKTVGAVTSSTFSPMLGHAAIGFAMIKWARRQPGTRLFAPAEGGNVPLEVHGMRFYAPASRT